MKIVPMTQSSNVNPVTQKKQVEFVGQGILIGSVGSKAMTYTNIKGIEKSYRLATAKVFIPKVGEKNLLLQVHEGNLKNAVGLKKEDEWESEDQIEEAVAKFESGTPYLCTVRPTKKTNGSGWTLLGNISHIISGGSDNDLTDDQAEAMFGDFDAEQDESPVTEAEKQEANAIGN